MFNMLVDNLSVICPRLVMALGGVDGEQEEWVFLDQTGTGRECRTEFFRTTCREPLSAWHHGSSPSLEEGYRQKTTCH